MMSIRNKKIVLTLLSIIGLLLIPIVIYQSEILWKTLFVSMGSSVFGASLSNLFSLVGNNIIDIRKI